MTELKHPELVEDAIAAQLVKMVCAVRDDTRKAAEGKLDDGASVTLYTPLGGKLGKATCSDPAKKVAITSRADFDAAIRAKHPEKVLALDEVSPDRSAVLAVLREHAPELVVTTSVVDPLFMQDVLNASLDAGEPMWPDGELDVPGLEVVKPTGVQSIRLDPKTAPQAVADMWQRGLLNPDGSLRAALPAGGAE